MEERTLNICLLGDGGVGKTTWINQVMNNTFEQKYVATLGVTCHSVALDTDAGIINFNIWDCSGQEKIGGVRDAYYTQSDGAIIMYDVTNRTSYKSIEQWDEDYRRINSDAPVIYVANKCDITPAKVIPQEEHILISVKNEEDIFLPFSEIIEEVINN